MNPVQKLIKLRGVPIFHIAKELGVNYHSLQKVTTGARDTPKIREALASYFNGDAVEMFGPGAEEHIRHLMEVEILRQAESLRRELREKFIINP